MSGQAARLQRCRERLAAALRALAEAPTLSVNFDAAPPRLDQDGAHLPPLEQEPNGADWTAWRALADRLALRHRHPLPLRRSVAPALAPLVEALWQGRAEALGAQAWPGIAANLQATLPARAGAVQTTAGSVELPERLTLLVHEVLGVLPLTEAQRASAAAWRAELGLQQALERLATACDSPRPYAAQCLRIARRLRPAQQVPEPPRTPRPVKPVIETEAARGRRQRSRTGRTDAPDQSSQVPASVNRYRVYTRAFDRTLRPGDLAGAGELAALRRRLETAVGPQHRLIARLARQLERRLRISRPGGWRDLQEQGRLDPRRLHRVVTAPGWPLPYRRPALRAERDTAVTLLLDNSASMRGRRIQLAAVAAELLSRSLERCGFKVEVLGYTTADWDGGAAATAWRQAGQPSEPGRVAARLHVVYKGADQPWRRARNGLGLMLMDELLKENLDGEALEWAGARLRRRPERRRILVLLGDGVPHDRLTAAANGEYYLPAHLQAVIRRLERRADLELLAIGFGPAIERNYRRAVRVRRAEDLARALSAELVRLLEPL